MAQGAVLKWTLGFPSFSFVNPSDVFYLCLGVSLLEGHVNSPDYTQAATIERIQFGEW